MKKLYSVFNKLSLALLFIIISIAAIGQNTYSGNVLYHGNPEKPVHSVTVTIQNPATGYSQNTVTDADGYFELTNIPYGSFSITAETTLPAGGVELNDAFLVMLHLFNFITLEDYQAIAADVNDNGMIDWGDYWNILIDWIMYQLPFNNDPWLFDTLEYTFAQSKDGQSVGGNELGSTCSGDIEGSFIIEDDKEKSSLLVSNTLDVTPGEIFDITFTATENMDLAAVYMGIKYNDEILTVLDYETQPADMEFQTEEMNGMLGFNWMADNTSSSISITKDQPFITLTVKVNENTQPQEVNFSLDDESGYIALNSKKVYTTKMITQSINIQEQTSPTGINQLENIVSLYPNPASDYIVIETQQINEAFILSDLNGKVVLNTRLNKNKNNIDIRNQAPGYYFYQIGSGTTAKNGKIIITR